jgi:FkbM family methyltransferase
MAQVSRAVKRTILQLSPAPLRESLLARFPNLRKAAPEGRQFVFANYLGDISVNVDTRYKVERIMWSGTYEPPLYRFLQSRGIAGWSCLDIGANVGAISLMLAKLCGPGAKIYSFEPGPPNLARLRSNLALNPGLSSRVEIIPSGMGAQPSELWWAEEPGNPGNALVSDHGTDRIPITTVDDFVRDRHIQRIDFMKIDVEGMELDVMRGGRDTLNSLRPILYFETLPRYVKSGTAPTYADMESFLVAECRYQLFKIGPSGELLPANPRRPASYTVAMPQ